MIGRKIGMTQLYDAQSMFRGVTALEVNPGVVLEVKKYTKKNVAKVGFFPEIRERKHKKPLAGYFKKLNLPYQQYVTEIPVEENETLKTGDPVGIEVFSENEKVDVVGISKGKGFQGGMRRHNWSGQPAAHGSMSHRRIGSNGANTFPGRVLRGHRMPGHQGDARITIKNTTIVKIDKERNLLFVEGSVPGGKNAIVTIKKKA